MPAGPRLDFQPFDQIAKDFAGRAASNGLTLLAQKLQQLGDRRMRRIEWQLRLRRLQNVVQRNGAFSSGSFRQAHQVGCGQMPRRRGEHAGARDIVKGTSDQVKIREHVAHQRMLQYRELLMTNGTLRNETLPQADRDECAAGTARRTPSSDAPRREGVQVIRHPCGFVLGRFHFHDADFFAFGIVGPQNFLGKFGADFVLADHLRGHAENIGGGAVVVHHRDAVGSGVLAFFPAGEALKEKFEAAEGCTTETVDCLIVVSNNDNVTGFGAQ